MHATWMLQPWLVKLEVISIFFRCKSISEYNQEEKIYKVLNSKAGVIVSLLREYLATLRENNILTSK